MEFRRFHSSSLEIPPRKSTSKLPFLWKALKAKLDSLGSRNRDAVQAETPTSSPDDSSGGTSPRDDSHPYCSLSDLPQLPSALVAAHVRTGSPKFHPRISAVRQAESLQRGSSGGECSLPTVSHLGSGLPSFLRARNGSASSAAQNFEGGFRDLGRNPCTSAENSALSARNPTTCDSLQPSLHAQSLGEIVQSPSVQVDRVPSAPTASTRLLAISSAVPQAMIRPSWSLEDYTITKRLHKGSSSAVYRATCRCSGMPVALKVYFLQRVPTNTVHMIKREIEIQAQLVHKHVARLYGAFVDSQERVVLVQELAVRGDLYGVLQQLGGRMAPEKAAETVIRPFLEALLHLHSRGICHRDIKPENVLFTGSWRLLLADFGVSIDLHQERAVTRAGTQGYMAPEVERCPLKAQPDENKDDPRYAYSTAADIWAVGVLAYELMVGFPPVVLPRAGAAAGAGEVSGFVRCHMTASELHFPASVPAAARSLISAALAAEPQDRPTAAQMLQHPWLQSAAVPTGVPPSERPTAEEADTPGGEGGPCRQPHPPREVGGGLVATAPPAVGGRQRRVGHSSISQQLGCA